MRKIILIFLIPILLSYSTTYYISNLGNNGNSGTSDSTAWRSISKLDSALVNGPITAGDSINFRKGDKFFGQINLIDVNVPFGLIFSSYGDGAKPIIDGSIATFVLDSSYWDSSNNCYAYDLDANMPDSCKIINVAIGSEQMILAREPDITYSNNIPTDNYFDIDSWDPTPDTRLITSSSINFTGYEGAEFVAKVCKSWYDISEILDCPSSNSCQLSNENDYMGDYKEDYGFFIQNHFQALDVNNEWFVEYGDYKKPVKLYIKTDTASEGQTVYITGYSLKTDSITNYGNGFYIIPSSDDVNYTIKNLDMRNMRECVMIGRALSSSFFDADINIENNDFSNSFVGIDNYYNSDISILGNSFLNINSFGILSRGNNITIDDSDTSEASFENIGLILGYERNFFWNPSPSAEYINLVAIHTFGDYINIKNTDIKKVGYTGIKFSPINKSSEVEKDRVLGIDIDDNTIDKAMLAMSDGGGIYSWTCFNPDTINTNKIRNNTITNCIGNNSGTDGVNAPGEYDAPGIYLDALVCNIEVTDNEIYYGSCGILAQAGRGYKITGNTIRYSKEYDIKISYDGAIYNGGDLNTSDSISYVYEHEDDPSGTYGSYYWNNEHKTLKNLLSGHYIYLKIGDNYITGNKLYQADSTYASPNFYNMILGTWKEVNDSTLFELTGFDDPISNNLATGETLDDMQVLLRSADVINSSGISYVGSSKYYPVLNSSHVFNQLGRFNMLIIPGLKQE